MNENIKENLSKLESKLEENFDKFANLTKAKLSKTIKNEDTVLVIIDIQEKLAPVINNKEEIIKNSKILIETAKTLNFPIILTEQYPQGLGETLPEIKEALEFKGKFFEKNYFSAYKDESIKEYIDSIKRPNFILLGMESHICLYQTARDLLIKGYNVVIAEDASGSRTKKNHLNGMELIKGYGGRISNTETIMFDLLSKAGTEEFKKLSKLIK